MAQDKTTGVKNSDSTSEIAWVLYKINDAKAAVMLPKLPVVISGNNLCAEIESANYWAYADESIYEFRYYKKGPSIPSVCQNKQRFGSESLDRRLAEIRNGYTLPVKSEADSKVGDKAVKIFKWETASEITTRWVFPDMKNNRWLELSISSRPDKKPETQRFVESLKFSAAEGTKVGPGSPKTLGDMDFTTQTPTTDKTTRSMVLKAKPRAGYTDYARHNSVQGTVILRVTFRDYGGIGAISVVKGLPFGLTEQAVAAAQKIVFLPAREGTNPINVIRQVEYSFSIY